MIQRKTIPMQLDVSAMVHLELSSRRWTFGVILQQRCIPFHLSWRWGMPSCGIATLPHARFCRGYKGVCLT